MQNARSSGGRKTDVVILGCGRVGSRLAVTMANEGYDVAVVDTDQHSFRRLPDNFRGRTILGTGIDEDVLRRAGINQAQTFIAVSDNDNTNIMAAEIKPQEIVMRASHRRAPTRSRIRLLGTSNRKYPTKNSPAPRP